MKTETENAGIFTAINRAQNLIYSMDPRGAVEQLNRTLRLLAAPADADALTLADLQAVLSPETWAILVGMAAAKKAGAK